MLLGFSLKPHSSKPPSTIERDSTTCSSSDTLLELVLHHVLTDCLRLIGQSYFWISCCHPSAPAQSIPLSAAPENTISMPAEARREDGLCSCCLAVLFPGGLTVVVRCHQRYLHPSTNRSCRFSKALQGPERQGEGSA